jgi:hypothetical protein
MRPSDFVVDSAGSKFSGVRILIPPGGAGVDVLKVAFVVPRTVTTFRVFHRNKEL